jgi:hypothetical protein
LRISRDLRYGKLLWAEKFRLSAECLGWWAANCRGQAERGGGRVGVVWHLENCGKILPQPTAESAAACRGDGADPSQRGLGTLFGTKIPDPPHLPRNNQGHFQAITDISPFFQVEKLGMLRVEKMTQEVT